MIDRIVDKLAGLVLAAIFVVAAAALFIGLPALCYGLWVDSQSPTFALQKDEWVCSRSHQDATAVMVGQVVVPAPNTICDQWTRR